MPSLFSRLKGKDSKSKKKNGDLDLASQISQKPKWDDAWTRKTVEPDEIQELIKLCTGELKARGMTSIPTPLPRPPAACNINRPPLPPYESVS